MRTAITLLCAIGAAYHTYLTLSLYLAYPSTDKETKIRDSNILIPSIAICAMFKIDRKAQQLFPEKFLAYNKSRLRNDVFTLGELLQLTPNYTELFVNCELLNNEHYVDCTELSTVLTRIDVRQKCFSFFHTDSKNLTIKSAMIRGRTLFRAQLRLSDLVEDLIAISLYNYPDLQCIEGSTNYALFDSQFYQDVMLTYSEAKLTFLEHPYKGNCRNYPISQARVLNDCVVRTYLNSTQRWPADVFVNETHNASVLQNMFGDWPQKERAMCVDKVPNRQCFDIKYKLFLKSHRNVRNETRFNKFNIEIYGPDDQSTEVNEIAIWSFSELFSNVGGILSAWLGMSMILVCSSLHKKTRKLVEKRTTRHCRRLRRKLVWCEKHTLRNSVVQLICTVLCCWQIVFTMSSYFANPFVSEVSVYRPQKVERPSMTICINNDNDSVTDMTLTELSSLLPDAEHIIPYCLMRLPNLHRVRCLAWYKPIVTVNAYHKCFTLFDKKTIARAKANYAQTFDVYHVKNLYWFYAFINANNRDVTVLIHENSVLGFDVTQPNALQFQGSFDDHQKLFNLYSLSYTRSITRYFSGHRDSVCVKYADVGFHWRDEAVVNCSLEKFMEDERRLPRNVFVDEQDAERLSNYTISATDLRIDHECVEKFPKIDCTNIDYEVEVKERGFRDHVKEYNITRLANATRVAVFAPGGFEVMVEQQLKFDVVEMISAVGGIVSIWLGLSIVDIISSLVSFCVWVKRSYYDTRMSQTRPFPATRSQRH